MENVIELPGSDERHEILTQTSVGGLLGGTLLGDEPLKAYFEENEEPKYVLRNKKSGLTRRRESDEHTLRPDDNYQALAVITDLRVLVVVGRGSGDGSASVELADVVEAHRASGGFRTDKLVVETIEDETWEFPCRDDLDEVATYVDGTAGTWANAHRLLEDAEDHLEAAGDALDGLDPDGASDALENAESALNGASERSSEIGTVAVDRLGGRIDRLTDRLVTLCRQTAAVRGGGAHATAQRAWRDEAYETAARSYEEAIGAYRDALAREGSTPTDEALTRRLRGVAEEREVLRVAPLADADTSRRRASALDDPEEAALEWEQALEGYRDMLGLDWGVGERHFFVDRETIRGHAEAVADDAIEDHLEAGQRWLTAGDKLAVQGRSNQAERVYERARNQFEQAHRLAREVRPERADDIAESLREILDRLEGDVPAEPQEEQPLPAEAVRDTLASTPAEKGTDTGDDRTESNSDRTGAKPKPAIRPTDRNRGDSGDKRDSGRPDTEDGDPEARIRELDPDAFTELVATLWEEQGWSTTVFSSITDAVYDVVAIRELEDGEQRLLLWTVHRPDGGVLGPTAVDRAATARDTSQGGDSATVVTAGTFTSAAEERADELDVTVVDGEGLLELLETHGLAGALGESFSRAKSPQS